jgi:uncharacterized lipoprotein YddW (UPF0748 family)
MKHFLLIFSFSFLTVFSSYSTEPGRELRAVWLTSVYNIDWPHSTSVSATVQKERLITLLNELHAAHFNAVMFQVRPNADALYKSAHEPWSRWITGTRGQEPSYDPLAFLIQEANKRGMEVHAWLNPYRYENTAGEYAGRPGDYSVTHPELIINYNGKTYFDPGIPATTELIKKIVTDLISNYDLDGVIFDDYFYPSNLPNSYDQKTYDTYATQEFVGQWYATLTRGNFRRASVNNMIREVHQTIKTIDRSVVFGVSPAGIYSTQASAATQWGTTLPAGITGNDNYNAINCDPLAWLRDQSLDYISPQLYWQIGGSQDFIALTQWWAKEAKRHGRHHYPSLASYRLASSKTDAGWTASEAQATYPVAPDLYDTPANKDEKFNWPLSEIGNQIIANRENPHNLAQGVIFYNTRSVVISTKNLAQYLADDLYSGKTIFPVLDWIQGAQVSSPQIAEIGVVGGMETGTAAMNIINSPFKRFLLYGYDEVPTKESQSEGEFMQVVFGKDFSTFYHLDKSFLAVQEYLPNRELGSTSGQFSYQLLTPARVISPSNEVVCDDFEFSWEEVADSESYQVQIARAQNPGTLVFNSPLLQQNSFILQGGTLEGQEDYVFRVRTKAGNSVSWSQQGAFSTGQPQGTVINSPASGTQNTNLSVTIQWDPVASATSYHLQIATDPSFNQASMVVDQKPISLNLFTAAVEKYNTTHYVRVRAANTCGHSLWSTVNTFTTKLGTIAEFSPQSVLKTYPNPAGNSCEVGFPFRIGKRTILIHDSNGRTVARIQRSGYATSDKIDLSDLVPGFYIITIETASGQRFMSRLVKSL